MSSKYAIDLSVDNKIFSKIDLFGSEKKITTNLLNKIFVVVLLTGIESMFSNLLIYTKRNIEMANLMLLLSTKT